MGIFKRLSKLGSRRTQKQSANSQNTLRTCRFEAMEARRMLDVNPIVAGVTYLEGDGGSDDSPDYFEVTFQGGSATSTLTQFVINGDQDHSGTLSDGDMFFDVSSSSPGTGGFHPFQYNAARSLGLNASDIVSFSVSDDGLRLTVDVRNFVAGDRLAFTIDVDEVERDRVDKIASGVEFERTLFQATFEDAHYTFQPRDVAVNHLLEGGVNQVQHSGVFYDEYNQLFARGGELAGTGLNLHLDAEQQAPDRSDGSLDVYNLVPKPVTISGQVFHDEDLDCVRDVEETGIAGVSIGLQKFNTATGRYEQVATTTTDATGQYHFGTELDLQPGKYRIVETQPNGYLNVGADPGTVEGNLSGEVENVSGQPNVITEVSIPLGNNAAVNYDFCEVRPASISGHVWHDRDDDGVIDSGEERLANVLIQITRIGSKPGQDDPFATTAPIFVRTDSNGFYEATGLPPGIYEVVEVNTYPPGSNPLSGYIDGKDSLGQVAGADNGTKVNDRFNQIMLCPDDAGVQYNFGELKPVSISGYVSITTPDGECLDPNDPGYRPIAGVTIQLLNANGALIATTLTDANGLYSFGDLTPGTYTVVEIQPGGYLDAEDSAGTVDGTTRGNVLSNDRISQIVLTSGQNGVNYEFCEHLPASLCGQVWHDRNDDGIRGPGEEAIADVVIELYDAQGNKIAETRTDAEGEYCFNDLVAGEYCVKEIQPTAYDDGKDSLGDVFGVEEGEALNDQFCFINLKYGDHGDNYDFGELKFGSIAGRVHADANGDCEFEPEAGDLPLGGVVLELLDSSGAVVGTTTTNAQGLYSFNGLRPGTYTVREVQPEGYIDGEDTVGTVGGSHVGTLANDLLSGIVIGSGSNGVNYDFCEHIPASLCGNVWHDLDNDGVRESGEPGIANVTIQLFDVDGNLVATTTTDSTGKYCFENLIAGEYCVKEIQPTGYSDGKDSLGNVDGTIVGEKKNDELCHVVLVGGQHGDDYDFGEIKLGRLSGYVHTDNNGNCVFDANQGELPLSGVTMQLVNSLGIVIATARTDAHGFYQFDQLVPDTYSVRQLQPNSYFTVGQAVGQTDTGAAGTGNDSVANAITGIQVGSGAVLVQYNFCEQAPAKIQGRVWEDGPRFRTESGLLPINYRDQRDGVYQAGTDTPITGVRMTLWYYTDIASGSLNPRQVTLADVLPGFYSHMTGLPGNTPVYLLTDANGEYSFGGLKAGSYIVLQEQPTGFADANDVPGTTTGFTYNSEIEVLLAPTILADTFTNRQLLDSVNAIQVTAGGVSLQNNFTEVRVVKDNEPPFLPPPPRPPHVSPPPPTPPGPLGLYLAGAQGANVFNVVGSSVAIGIDAGPANPEYTWHLSVVNSGDPRGDGKVAESRESVWMNASFSDDSMWSRSDMDETSWSFASKDGDRFTLKSNDSRFGMMDGFPLAGDWNGDGIDEIGVFWNGFWFIDVDGNQQFDKNDLVAKLGNSDDQAVVGDWDGDGKDDIGIFGPIWPNDEPAIAQDPGLPNPANRLVHRPKNTPPRLDEATEGARIMRLTSAGKARADLIDHVFRFGKANDIAVAGDWNGSGIRSIGIFNDGNWMLDANGNGRWESEETQFTFGSEGDLPVVGDFNGDGIEEVGVFHDGTWSIDINGNHELDAQDLVFELGDVSDLPVVGDFNGDGVDEPALYHRGSHSHVAGL